MSMEQGFSLLLALSLGLLQPGCGQPLRVEPPEPVVAVAMGASQQFTCRLTCTRGMATVRWRGLDTNLGAVQSEAGSSVLSVRNASLSAAGTRVCVGSCEDRTFQHTVQLLVYAFPDQLTVSPATLVPGQDQEVACTAHSVSPADPDTLSFSLFLGNRELEGVQVLGREEEEEEEGGGEQPQEAEDLLFRVTERWLLPPLETPASPPLHCQATMRLPGLELSHRRALPVLHIQASLEPTDLTSPESPNATSPQTPNLTSLKPPKATSQESPIAISPEATLQQGSTGTPRINSSPETCHPEIHQSLPPAADREVSWELLCEAVCGPGVAVHWTLAPGGLAAYERREAGAQAWLSVPQASSSPEGLFQCRLDPGGQVASLYVPSQKVIPKTSPGPEAGPQPTTLWTSSLVLGLLLMLLLAYRLWRRCRPQPMAPPQPPASLCLLPVSN